MTAGPDRIVILGPLEVSELTAYDVELELEASSAEIG